MELKQDALGELHYLAFYPDDPQMVKEARELFDREMVKGNHPIIIASTGRWCPIKNFNEAYGCIQKRIFFD